VYKTLFIAYSLFLALVNIFTWGGRGGATRVLIQHIYDAGFRDLELGYASAVSLFLFAVMLIVAVVQFRVIGRDK
jgi:multiple sugar transport system permease protein